MKIANALVERARGMRIEHVIEQRGIKLRGKIERVGPCPRCGGRDRFAINTAKQVFVCRGFGGGDVIAMVQHLDRVDFFDAVTTLICSPVTAANIHNRACQSTDTVSTVSARDECERQQHCKAGWLWSQRRHIAGTPAEFYLRYVRQITCPLPPTLGYLPPSRPKHYPTMIGAFGIPGEPEPGILGAPREVSAVHLTLLKPNGTKADVKPNKITIGSPAGMPIVLAPMNDILGLAITEGIEDALTIYMATGLGAWAAGSAPFLPKLVAAIEKLATKREYDASPDCITIFVDDDVAGRRNAQALATGLTKLSAKLAAASGKTTHFDILMREARR